MPVVPIDSLITAVCVILSAMPAASTSVVLAVKYGKRRPPGNEDRCLFHGRLIDHTSDLVLFPAVGDPVGLSR